MVLQAVSNSVFPDSSKPFPEGTQYRPPGATDHLYYVLSKPTAALRATIEFMQKWHETAALGYPDCVALIDGGQVDSKVSGPPIRRLNAIKDRRDAGKIYITKATADLCDQTVAKFAHRGFVSEPRQSKFVLYEAIFDDPRTVEDSALVHALFVAAPEAKEARERVFELFLVEHLLEHNHSSTLEDFYTWARKKNYSLPDLEQLRLSLETSTIVTLDSSKLRYHLTKDVIDQIDFARLEYEEARQRCRDMVAKSVNDALGTSAGTKNLDVVKIIDEYLSAIFLEVRLLANYFRRGYAIFETASESFTRFDYVIKRQLPEGSDEMIEPWRRGFVIGLKKASEVNNLYIASVFHNVLATYYLNRAGSTSPYQLKRLRNRVIYIDTNVLYALRVEASNYHELVDNLLRNLVSIGVIIKVFPFTIEEFERSLLAVEEAFEGDRPRPELIRWNPWLFQEFMLRRGKYMNRISVCRQVHRVKGESPECNEEAYDAVDKVLKPYGILLERDFDVLQDSEIDELWSEYSHKMPSNSWSLDEYWEFLYRAAAVPFGKKRHDVQCLFNVGKRVNARAGDELGPQTLFLTLDRNRLLRLRKVFRYIAGAEQLLEFFLPYFFLKDIPITEAETFPNELLAAQLGTLLVKRPPKIAEIAEAYIRDSRVFESVRPGAKVTEIEAVAAAMSDSRFSAVTSAARSLPKEEGAAVSARVAATLEDIKAERIRSFYEHADELRELAKLRAELSDMTEQIRDKENQVNRLQRTVGYWKGQARAKKE